jgi:parvulin-like peptidyl-prolyl isomerase
MNTGRFLRASAIAGFLALSHSIAAADTPPVAPPEPLHAIVNGKQITLKEFHAAYSNYLRQKYYHGQVPEGKLAEARKEVSDRMIERILLIEDAAKRGLAPDGKRIEQTIQEYDARYAVSQMWQQNRERMLPGLRQQLADQDILQQMEVIGHHFPEPTEQAVADFYTARIDLFTEPEKMRLHTILLKVDPSAPKTLWDAAREEAARIVARLRAGEISFDEAARLHSHDRSAEKGGDMGYLHQGMIPEQVQAQIDTHPLGTVTDPVDVLEGIALFRLDERVQPKVMPMQDVAGRARELLKREQSDKAWEAFIAKLRATASIKMIEAAATSATAN